MGEGGWEEGTLTSVILLGTRTPTPSSSVVVVVVIVIIIIGAIVVVVRGPTPLHGPLAQSPPELGVETPAIWRETSPLLGRGIVGIVRRHTRRGVIAPTPSTRLEIKWWGTAPSTTTATTVFSTTTTIMMVMIIVVMRWWWWRGSTTSTPSTVVGWGGGSPLLPAILADDRPTPRSAVAAGSGRPAGPGGGGEGREGG